MIKPRYSELRKALGFTQKQVADFLNISRTTYTQYERGSSAPNLETLDKLSELFHVTIDYLLGKADVNLSSKESQPIINNQDKNSKSDLTDDQQKLIEQYNDLDPELQAEFQKLMKLYKIKTKADGNNNGSTTSTLNKNA